MSGELAFRFGPFRTRVLFTDRPDLAPAPGASGALTVFDANTFNLLGRGAANPTVIQVGEEHKSWSSAEAIFGRALSLGLGRDGMILGVGGGVICDLAAFCASAYMRGCRLALVPTTLLAMVDAALGGKTALNLQGYKNTVGTFYPAEEVRVSVKVLGSLPEKEYRSGLAEAIKTAMIGDAALFELLGSRGAAVLARDEELLEQIVRRCLAVKGGVVEEDSRETGKREVLNLGHTFAHALETVGGLKGWNHGEAVAWGLARAMDLGLSLGITKAEYARAVKQLLACYGFTLRAAEPGGGAELLEAMRADKKKREGKLRFVLQRGLCDTLVQTVAPAAVRDIMNQD